jgi:tetratricopeptide (TPR) repeat protein
MSRERIQERNPLAALIFDILGFFRADDIPFDLIHLYFPFKTKEEIAEALVLLDKFALIRNFKDKISIHRTIQYVIIESLKFNSRILLTFTYFIRFSMRILEKETAHPQFNSFVYHILKSTEYLDAITNEKEHTVFKLKLADLVIDDHCFYYRTGKILQEAYDETRQRSGQCHSEALMIQVRMAHLKTNKEEYEEAKVILEEVLHKLIGKFGEEHRDVLKTQFTMGRLFVEQENWDEGLELLNEVLEKQLKLLGEKDKDTVKTRESIEYYVKNRVIREKYRKEREAAELEEKMRRLTTQENDAGSGGAEGGEE